MIDPHNPRPSGTAEDTPARFRLDGPSVPESFPAAAAAAEYGPLEARVSALEAMAHAATLPMVEQVEPGRPHCQRCEVLPRKMEGPGTVHLYLPHTHTLGKVLSWVVRGRRPHERAGGVVRLEAPAGSLAPLLAPLVDLLSSTERRDTRAMFQPAGEAVTPDDYFRIEHLDGFVARAGSDWLIDLMRQDRLVAHFHPILTADGRTVFGHECLLRGMAADGRTMPPGPMFEVARRADLVFQLDLAARRAALRGAARHRLPAKVFVNFTPNAIYDAESCLDSTVRMVDDLGLTPGQVVFEVVESERLPDLGHLKAIVAYHRRHGFEVALDDLGAGYAALHLLAELRPDYVKLDMSLVRGVHADPAKAVVTRKILEMTRELGLRTVAEGVETREEWAWVREHGADFVQGFLFAKPAAPPAVPALL